MKLTGEAGVVAFILDYGDAKVRRLVSQTVETTFPAKLSDTGLFADLSFNPGIERYDINLPFWSDYAIKEPLVHAAERLGNFWLCAG